MAMTDPMTQGTDSQDTDIQLPAEDIVQTEMDYDPEEVSNPSDEVLNEDQRDTRDIVSKHLNETNIASKMEKAKLDKIGLTVVEEYKIDEESRVKWLENMRHGMKLAMQVYEQKNYPFNNAANIKYPMITIAAIQFASRTYPTLVPEGNIVKAKVWGQDEDGSKAARAGRISEHMSWQCLEQMEEWEEHTDKLLTALPILGCCFKKTYYSARLGRNVSEFVSPEYVVMPYYTKNMKYAARITHVYELYPNQIEEMKRAGVFLDIDLYDRREQLEEHALFKENSMEQGGANTTEDPHIFLEQHRWLDLDDDGYSEPYIVTVHKDSGCVVRINARYDADGIIRDDDGKILRIEPVEYFTKYSFVPSADGSVYDIGYGSMLGPINETINTTTNMLLDSGTISNSQSGFISKGVNLGRGKGSGNINLALNEWRQVQVSGNDLKNAILPLPAKEPSPTLMSLLQFMVGTGEKLSSVTEVMMGEQSVQNEPATTTLSRLEQSMKLFSSIHKRLRRAMREEFKKLYRLNGLYLKEKEYYRVLDNEKAISRKDYALKDADISPTGSSNDITNTQRMVKAGALLQLVGQGFNDIKIKRRYLEALQIDDYQELLPDPNAQPPIDPKVQMMAEELKLKAAQFDLENRKFAWEQAKYSQTIQESKAKIIHMLAQAEAAEKGSQLNIYKAMADEIRQQVEKETGMAGQIQPTQGGMNDGGAQRSAKQTGGAEGGNIPSGIQGMEEPSGNEGVNVNPEEISG